MFGNHTHIIVSLLKAWKMTILEIECNGATFFKKVTPEVFCFVFQNSACRMANSIIVDIVKYFY